MRDTVEKPPADTEKRTLIGENESRIVVIDIGKKQKKKAIRQLHQGRGSCFPRSRRPSGAFSLSWRRQVRRQSSWWWSKEEASSVVVVNIALL